MAEDKRVKLTFHGLTLEDANGLMYEAKEHIWHDIPYAAAWALQDAFDDVNEVALGFGLDAMEFKSPPGLVKQVKEKHKNKKQK